MDFDDGFCASVLFPTRVPESRAPDFGFYEPVKLPGQLLSKFSVAVCSVELTFRRYCVELFINFGFCH